MTKFRPKNIFETPIKFIFIHIPKNAGSSVQKWLHINDKNIPKKWNGHNISNVHSTASLYKQQLGDNFSSYYSFAIIRNPWDRMLSFYKWTVLYGKYKHDLERWLIENKNTWVMTTQYDYISYSNETIVNFVGRFENLYDDLSIVSENINIPMLNNFYHENETKHSTYKDAYTSKAKKIIDNIFEKDIDMFKYTFE